MMGQGWRAANFAYTLTVQRKQPDRCILLERVRVRGDDVRWSVAAVDGHDDVTELQAL